MMSWAPGRIFLRCHGAARSIAFSFSLRSLPVHTLRHSATTASAAPP